VTETSPAKSFVVKARRAFAAPQKPTAAKTLNRKPINDFAGWFCGQGKTCRRVAKGEQ
jgi:hypothetical protein